ncbi:acylneuraminate cytidylyltransferase, partial [Streptococcus ruminantium]|nr:acylneuraminate cytidylyltransferase [Streptococcus ruminantium]
MEPVCIIPARSGSKGLPNKNMLFLDGKPMIFHTIHAAIESGCFKKENIFVSTDSEHYKK